MGNDKRPSDSNAAPRSSSVPEAGSDGDSAPGRTPSGMDGIPSGTTDGAEPGKPVVGRDPPVVPDPILPFYLAEVASSPGRNLPSDPTDLSLGKWWAYLTDILEREAYGAPRVFDLFTLLAVTVAWALLFALLRVLEPLLEGSLPYVALGVGCYITLIAICQMVLFHGEKPRVASVVGGPIAWLATALIVGLVAGPRSWLELLRWGMANLCFSPIGFFFGYLAGGAVAGVFLLADAFRQHYLAGRPQEDAGDDDAIWREDDAPPDPAQTGAGAQPAEIAPGRDAGEETTARRSDDQSKPPGGA
ncbi:MAG: hypothetical protein D6753_12035 [Planctomycetota bacterium]|nr:MAG: hypothetical protein D6753_12035 [Planctomycetota bacterium]